MRYLRIEEILAIHDETIEQEGGRLGVRDMHLLYSLVERPKMAMMGQEFYSDLWSKAAAMLEGLATYHVFTDANKRTAFLTTTVFLGINGYELVAPDKPAYRFILAVAQKQKTIKDIARWLKKHGQELAD